MVSHNIERQYIIVIYIMEDIGMIKNLTGWEKEIRKVGSEIL